MTQNERLARLEGIIEEIRNRLDSLDSRISGVGSSLDSRISGVDARLESRINGLDARLNTLTAVTVAMWVTTMLAVLSTLAAVLLRT